MLHVLEDIFGSGFGSCTGFGSGQNLVPVSAQFLKLNFGLVPVSVDFPVPADHYSTAGFLYRGYASWYRDLEALLHFFICCLTFKISNYN